MKKIFAVLGFFLASHLSAAEDLNSALRRSKYLLNGAMPSGDDFANYAVSQDQYRAAIRDFVNDDRFYDAVLRYHERIFGVGLPEDYMEELVRDDIDGKQEKFASITCGRFNGNQGRFSCVWTSNLEADKGSGCPVAWEKPVSVFWYPGIVAWVCPSVMNACGQNLSGCFIQSTDEDEARNSELGTTESFDSRFAVMRSLSRQSAGLATAVAVQNYPYTKILEPGLTAVDGAIAHFYGQQHHFRINELDLNPQILSVSGETTFNDTRYSLLKVSGDVTNTAGIISTFGWLRRYDKNRTRGNELYKRLLCQDFTSELPRVFPQDPGNLRDTPGCSGCHSALDPLADFFLPWGEGADLYSGRQPAIKTNFFDQEGSSIAELADIIRGNEAFATCTVQNVWYWLMGRKFYTEEEPLRTVLREYFSTTNYSFRELVYAIATHPAFTEGSRSDGVISDPLKAPSLVTITESEQEPQTPACDRAYDFAADIQPKLSVCTSCHYAGSSQRQDLSTEAQWRAWRSTALPMMGTGAMPIGPFNPAAVEELRQAVQCWTEQNP